MLNYYVILIHMAMTREQKNARQRAYRAADKLKPLTEERKALLEQRKALADAKTKARRATPEFKARARAHKNSPEALAKKAAYESTEEYKAWRKAYYSTPTARAKAKTYGIEYRDNIERRLQTILNTSRRSVKVRGRAVRKLEHTITYDDLVELYDAQEGKCALTGWELSTRTRALNTISLDRIDSNIGYIKGNIQFVSAQANRCKNAYTMTEFIALCEAVVKRQQNAG